MAFAIIGLTAGQHPLTLRLHGSNSRVQSNHQTVIERRCLKKFKHSSRWLADFADSLGFHLFCWLQHPCYQRQLSMKYILFVELTSICRISLQVKLIFKVYGICRAQKCPCFCSHKTGNALWIQVEPFKQNVCLTETMTKDGNKAGQFQLR